MYGYSQVIEHARELVTRINTQHDHIDFTPRQGTEEVVKSKSPRLAPAAAQ